MILILILINIIARVIPHTPNFAAIGATGLFCGYTQSKWKAAVLVIAIMIVTDYALLYFNPYGTPTFDGFISPSKIFYGSTQIFVWGSFLVNTFIGRSLRRSKEIIAYPISCMACSLQFFLVTNAGVWIAGSYDRSIHGLYQSYVAGIPFFRGTLEGDLIYTIVIFGMYEVIKHGSIVHKVEVHLSL